MSLPANRILCDFDGTITPFDVTDAVLEKFALASWVDLERDWDEGRITAHECMQGQIGLIRAEPNELNAFLDTVPLTEGVIELIGYCKSVAMPFSVISDGMDYSIRRILRHHNIEVPVISNHLCHDGEDRYHLEFPFQFGDCPSGVCKCHAGQASKPFILIGDGASDCCLASRATFVFARRGKKLERICQQKGYCWAPYDDFNDILSALKRF